jgi:hypothetical protein
MRAYPSKMHPIIHITFIIRSMDLEEGQSSKRNGHQWTGNELAGIATGRLDGRTSGGGGGASGGRATGGAAH